MKKFLSAIIHDDYISWSCEDGRTGSDPYTGADPFGHLCDRFPDCHIETHDARSATTVEGPAAHRAALDRLPEWAKPLVGKFVFKVTFESGNITELRADSFAEVLEAIKDLGFPMMIQRNIAGFSVDLRRPGGD